MKAEIKKRIEAVKRGEVPEVHLTLNGYKNYPKKVTGLL